MRSLGVGRLRLVLLIPVCFLPNGQYDQKPGFSSKEALPVKADDKTDTSALPSDFLVGYAPGQPAEILKPGEGKLIKAGSDIVFEVHHTERKSCDGPD